MPTPSRQGLRRAIPNQRMQEARWRGWITSEILCKTLSALFTTALPPKSTSRLTVPPHPGQGYRHSSQPLPSSVRVRTRHMHPVCWQPSMSTPSAYSARQTSRRRRLGASARAAVTPPAAPATPAPVQPAASVLPHHWFRHLRLYNPVAPGALHRAAACFPDFAPLPIAAPNTAHAPAAAAVASAQPITNKTTFDARTKAALICRRRDAALVAEMRYVARRIGLAGDAGAGAGAMAGADAEVEVTRGRWDRIECQCCFAINTCVVIFFFSHFFRVIGRYPLYVCVFTKPLIPQSTDAPKPTCFASAASRRTPRRSLPRPPRCSSTCTPTVQEVSSLRAKVLPGGMHSSREDHFYADCDA
jgi:hypothetical protein